MNRFRFLLSLMLVLALAGGAGLLYRDAAARQVVPGGAAASGKAMRPAALTQPTCTGLQWDTRLSATNGVNGVIRAIAVNGGDIYVAGSFTQAGNVAANNVAKWNEQFNVWSSLGTGAANGVNGGVYTLKVSGNFVYAGGSFTQAGGAAASNIARFDLTSGLWSSLGAGAANGTNDRVNDIEVSGNEVFAGGNFTQAGGAPASHIAKWTAGTNAWSAFGTGLPFTVDVVTLVGSDLYAEFAKWNPATSTWTGEVTQKCQFFLPPYQNKIVSGPVVIGSDLYVSDVFSLCDPTVGEEDLLLDGCNTNLPRISPPICEQSFVTLLVKKDSTGNVNSFRADILFNNPTGYMPTAMAAIGNDLYVSNVLGAIYKWVNNTNDWTSLDTLPGAETNGEVCAIAGNGCDVYVGGTFTMAGGRTVSNFARYGRPITCSLTFGCRSNAIYAFCDPENNDNDTLIEQCNFPASSCAIDLNGSPNCISNPSGRVWQDTNRNGVQDTGEPGIQGATVTTIHAGANGSFGDGDDRTASAPTDSNGVYLIAPPTMPVPPPGDVLPLTAGNVRFVVSNLPAGFVPTYDPDSGTTNPDGIATYNNVPQGMLVTNVHFGFNVPCQPITIPTSLPNGFQGMAYNQTLTATGGVAPYTFAITSGAMPNGLTLATNGTVIGTPMTPGTYTFCVTVTDNAGCSGLRCYTMIVSGNGLMFYPLPSPVRLLDTRSGFSGCVTSVGTLAAGSTRTQPARTLCSTIPANATAVIGNITVAPSAPGYLTLFPSDATQPTVANSNFNADEITNNFFTVGLGAAGADAGAFKIFTSATTHVIIDLTGYYAPPGAGGLYYHPLTSPVRLVETRAGFSGCIAPGAQLIGTGDPNADPNLDLSVQGRSPVASPCNSIPASAQVLVGNATSVVPDNGGYLTIYPSGGTRPLIASSNYVGSDVINGPFSVKLGADGKFKIYTLRTTHLVVDILGYYSEEAVDANGVGLLFSPLPVPVRLLETRPGGPPLVGCTRTNAPIQGNLNAATHTQQAAGFCGLPASAQAVVGNVSVVSTPGAGFLTLFPGNLTNAPLVATSNYPTPAAAGYNRHYFVGLSPIDGTFKVLTQFTTELILDASGYFAP